MHEHHGDNVQHQDSPNLKLMPVLQRSGVFKLKGPGPVAWCKRCSRRHQRRDCELHEVTRISKAGHKVKRLAHKPKRKSQAKTKARKS